MSTTAERGTRSGWRLLTGVLLVRASHPRQALVTAALLATAAAAAGRPLREVALVALTVLVGQALLGWGDDLADRGADRRQGRDKPLVGDRLDPGTVWFALSCGVLLVVPLSISHGERPGLTYLASLLVALVGDRFLHGRVLSFLPWMASFALYPAFLAHGGWSGVGTDTPPTTVMVVLFAVLGLCVHVLLALPGLVGDHAESERSLPLMLALRLGTPRLLLVASVLAGVTAAAILAAGRTVGLT